MKSELSIVAMVSINFAVYIVVVESYVPIVAPHGSLKATIPMAYPGDFAK